MLSGDDGIFSVLIGQKQSYIASDAKGASIVPLREADAGSRPYPPKTKSGQYTEKFKILTHLVYICEHEDASWCHMKISRARFHSSTCHTHVMKQNILLHS